MTNLKFARIVFFSPPTSSFFLIFYPFSFCDSSFELKFYFLNILIFKFKKKEKKSFKNNEGKRKLWITPFWRWILLFLVPTDSI
jgi:hypothetical protein